MPRIRSRNVDRQRSLNKQTTENSAGDLSSHVQSCERNLARGRAPFRSLSSFGRARVERVTGCVSSSSTWTRVQIAAALTSAICPFCCLFHIGSLCSLSVPLLPSVRSSREQPFDDPELLVLLTLVFTLARPRSRSTYAGVNRRRPHSFLTPPHARSSAPVKAYTTVAIEGERDVETRSRFR